MKHSLPLVCRLLALVALWPALTLGQESAPAAKPEAEPAAAPAATTAPAVEYSKKGADTCLELPRRRRDPRRLPRQARPAGRPGSPFGQGQLQCEACHGPAGDHTKRVKKGETRPPVIRFGRDSAAPVAVQNGMCLGCHEKSMASSWHVGAHDAANVSCASCHDSHARKDAVLSTRTQADVCYTCHVAERGQFLKAYAHPVRQGQLACSDCHAPHGSTADKQLVKATLNQTCYECHADKRGPFLWEHAPVAEDCSSCHSPHGASNPVCCKARGPVLCQSCHSQQGHPSSRVRTVRDLPGGGGSPASSLALGNCMNCHSQVHGSNHPSGATLTR